MGIISRDIQEKEIKSMHKAIYGCLPKEDIGLLNDDQIDRMFDSLTAKLYNMPNVEPDDEEWY